tara:strand:- start:85 stop:954 length:870 start_codon:yes stop_codon:yes gene_type:complete
MPSKYDAINKIKAKNPELTWTQAARQAGFSGEWTSYKGRAKPRTGDATGQARRRAKFDQPSTEMAGYESKRLQQEVARLNAEAEMYGLEPYQIEHLLDQSDAKAIQQGSSGDPTNKVIVTQTAARFKDRVRQNVPPGYTVTLNPTTESVRVVPDKFFDPVADPDTLPGVDVPVGSDLSNLKNSLSATRGSISFKRGTLTGLAAGGIVALGPLGTAVSAAETAGRKEIADETGNPVDRVQQYISGASLAADAASYAPPLTVPATIVSTGLDAINVGIDTTRGFINLFTRR